MTSINSRPKMSLDNGNHLGNHTLAGDRRQLKDPKVLVNDNQYRYPLVNQLYILLTTIYSIPIFIQAIFKLIFKRKKLISGKICMVTGSGRGLGRSIAQSLAKEGAKVICVDINEKNNHETAQLIKDEGGLAAAYTVNVAKVEQVMELAKTIEIEHGPVDILVNNAALVMGMTVAEWDPAEIIASYNVNVLSLYWMVMAFLPSMRKRNDGHIVAISSISALAPTICLSIYGATKAAVSNLMANLVQEVQLWDKKNIKFTTIHPFFINTSEDYLSFFKLKWKPMSIKSATRQIMDAILYEKESVSVPGHMSFFAGLIRMMPSKVWNKLYQVLGAVPQSPDKEMRQTLVYYDIVNDSQ